MAEQAQNNNNEEGGENKNKIYVNDNFVDLKMDTLNVERSIVQIHPIHDLLYEAYRMTIWLWPYAFVFGMPSFFLIFYLIAAYNDHLGFILQYVSDSGTYLPSAGFFAEGLDMMAFCLFITFLARYKQVKYYIHVKICQHPQYKLYGPKLVKHLDLLNFASLLMAFGIVFSIISIGNFRCSEGFIFHVTSAFCMFFATFIYAALMIAICRTLYSRFDIESPPTTVTVWLVTAATLLLGVFTFNVISSQFGVMDGFFDEHTNLHWRSDQPGYWWHVASAACEWTLVNSMAVLFACLSRRMANFKNWDKIDDL